MALSFPTGISCLRALRNPIRLVSTQSSVIQPSQPHSSPPSSSSPNSYLTSRSKHFVRIAGPASYASRADLFQFLSENSLSPDTTPSSLVQGQSDIFQNHSVWLYNAGTQPQAEHIASHISGKIVGLKLIRAAAVDQRIVDSMLSVPQPGTFARTTLRRRLNIIAPKPEERGRALLAANLPHLLQPRYLWSFFANYEVLHVRHLRKSGVACIVFASEDEAQRALRERANIHLHGKQPIALKVHE